MKYKVILKKEYNELKFVFDDPDEAGAFLVNALRHNEGLEAKYMAFDGEESKDE